MTFDNAAQRRVSLLQQQQNSSDHSYSKKEKEELATENSTSSPTVRNSIARNAPSFNFGKESHQVSKQVSIGPSDKIPLREIEVVQDSLCDDDAASNGGIKLRPGETKEEALERIRKQKEIKRIEKLMKFAFPRLREEQIMKRKVLGPENVNESVDYMRLKREAIRIDRNRSYNKHHSSY